MWEILSRAAHNINSVCGGLNRRRLYLTDKKNLNTQHKLRRLAKHICLLQQAYTYKYREQRISRWRLVYSCTYKQDPAQAYAHIYDCYSRLAQLVTLSAPYKEETFFQYINEPRQSPCKTPACMQIRCLFCGLQSSRFYGSYL